MHTAALLTLRSLFVVFALLAAGHAVAAVWYIGHAISSGSIQENVGTAFFFTVVALFLFALLIPLARPLFAPRERYRHTG